MKIAIYPGSFSPWHRGHTDVLRKALKIFDQVTVASPRGPNSSKEDTSIILTSIYASLPKEESNRVNVLHFSGLLANFIKDLNDEDQDIGAVVRGLRNNQDFEYEKIQQYWNEDLGIEIPIVYFISDRALTHISSSAIKTITKGLTNGKNI